MHFHMFYFLFLHFFLPFACRGRKLTKSPDNAKYTLVYHTNPVHEKQKDQSIFTLLWSFPHFLILYFFNSKFLLHGPDSQMVRKVDEFLCVFQNNLGQRKSGFHLDFQISVLAQMPLLMSLLR